MGVTKQVFYVVSSVQIDNQFGTFKQLNAQCSSFDICIPISH